MKSADEIKVIKIVDDNKSIINEANRRLSEIRRSKWKSTPATDMVKSYLKKSGTKKGTFKLNKQMTPAEARRSVAEAKRYLAADTSTVEGYEDLVDKRTARFMKAYGSDWGQTDLQRKQFFKALASKWYDRLLTIGVESEALIRYATLYSDKTTSTNEGVVSERLKDLYESVIITSAEGDLNEKDYADVLMNRRVKRRTGGQASDVMELFNKEWYEKKKKV